MGDKQGEPGGIARVLGSGDVELADVLGGDVGIRANVDDVDALNVIDILQVLDGLRDHLPGNVRLAKARLIGNEKAPA